MEYLGAWETLNHEKNLKSKISCQTPFNLNLIGLFYLILIWLVCFTVNWIKLTLLILSWTNWSVSFNFDVIGVRDVIGLFYF